MRFIRYGDDTLGGLIIEAHHDQRPSPCLLVQGLPLDGEVYGPPPVLAKDDVEKAFLLAQNADFASADGLPTTREGFQCFQRYELV